MNLNYFTDKNLNLAQASREFFDKELNIKLNGASNKPVEISTIIKQPTKAVSELFPNIIESYFLGLIDDSVFEDAGLFGEEKLTYNDAFKKIDDKYKGIMVFGIKLDKTFNRSSLAEITRAFNKASKQMPVIVL